MSTATAPIAQPSHEEQITAILAQVASGAIAPAVAGQLIGALNQTRKAGELSLKHSEKGVVSLYGINSRFPVNAYPDQWERILGFADEIRAYITANRPELDKLGAASKVANQAAKAAEKAAKGK